MFFNVKDVSEFQSQKEFIDTVIIPLLSINLTENMIKQSSSAAEYLMSLTAFIEQQFKGRLMLFPPFTYTEETKERLSLEVLKKECHQTGFKHVLFITCDHSWTSSNEKNDVIWLPPIPLESMDKMVKKTILEDQLKQVIPILSSKWSQN
nr:YpiF family protein [Lysinibacillus timonensis]